MQVIGPDEIRRINPFVTTEGVLAGAWTLDDGYVDPLERVQRDGDRGQAAGRARSSRTQPGPRHRAAAERRVPGLHRAGRHHLRARGQRRGLLRRPGERLAGRPDPVRQHEAPVRGHRARQGVRGARRRDPGHARPALLLLLPPGAEVGPDRHLRGQRHRGGLEWRRAARLGSPTNELFAATARPHHCRTSSGSWSGCRSSPTRASRRSSTAPSRTPRTATPWSGPRPGVRNFWLATGTGIGIAQGPGCGRYLAQWMVHGDARSTCWAWTRAATATSATRPTRSAKAHREYWDMYRLIPPGEERPEGRPAKNVAAVRHAAAPRAACSPRASAGSARSGSRLDGREEEGTFRRNNTFEVVGGRVPRRPRAGRRDGAAELRHATRCPAPDAEAFLDRVCANRMPRREGGIVLAHALSARTAATRPSSRSRACPATGSSCSRAPSPTSATWTCCTARCATARTSRSPIVTDGLHARSIVAGPAVTRAAGEADRRPTSATTPSRGSRARRSRSPASAVRALRVNYVGELGWELHVPMADVGRAVRRGVGGRRGVAASPTSGCTR